MKYTEKIIRQIYDKNLEQAIYVLSSIGVARGRKPNFKGLNGWVFEQTIRSCLEDEFEKQLKTIEIHDQFKLKGRASADLLFGKVAIEIKSGGLFADESDKYSRYREYANAQGYEYVYITCDETYLPYEEAAIRAFGDDKAFFLSKKESWSNFVKKIAEINDIRMEFWGHRTH